AGAPPAGESGRPACWSHRVAPRRIFVLVLVLLLVLEMENPATCLQRERPRTSTSKRTTTTPAKPRSSPPSPSLVIETRRKHNPPRAAALSPFHQADLSSRPPDLRPRCLHDRRSSRVGG